MGFNTNLNTNVWIYNNTNRVSRNTEPLAGMVQNPNPKPNPNPSIFQPILYPTPIKNPYPGTPGPIGGMVDPQIIDPDKNKPNPEPYPVCGMVPGPLLPDEEEPEPQPIGGMVPRPEPTLSPKPNFTPVPTNEPQPLGGSVYIPKKEY